MFLRRFQKRKNGKTHVYWALVESYRTARGSRQRVVSYLGELQDGEQSGWGQLAEKLLGGGAGIEAPKPGALAQQSLFDPPERHAGAAAAIQSRPALVDLQGVRLERSRDFGAVWLAWGLWRLLGLDTVLGQAMRRGREEVPWPVVAAILAIARFCKPSSELHIETTWYRSTALDDLLGVPEEKVHTDRLYAGLDELLPHKVTIEQHLKQRLGELFELDYELLLYDVTSTYFEGQCGRNPLGKRGHSRDKRPDCLQVCIGLVVTTDGLPVGYEVFAGNRHDSTTVEEIVEVMEKKYGRANRIWVMDRGMVSEANLSFVRSRDGRYLVGTPKATLRKFESHLVEQDWEQVEAGVEVKLVPSPEGDETFILARSAERREKEKAIHARFLSRMEAGLQQLKAAMEKGRLRDETVAHRRLGRLQGENSRAAKAFDVTIQPITPDESKVAAETGTASDALDQDLQNEPTRRDATRDEQGQTSETRDDEAGHEASGSDSKRKKKRSAKQSPSLRITWQRNERWDEWARLSEGCYLLRSNMNETDPKTLWKHYIQLTDAEWAFRICKDELVLRPIWHQTEDRVKAHILVCFIAYAMWKTLAGWMGRSGLGDAPRSLLDELSKITSGDVVLPVITSADCPPQELHLRCVTEPNPEQRLLLHRLGVRLPKRLGSYFATPKCSEDLSQKTT